MSTQHSGLSKEEKAARRRRREKLRRRRRMKKIRNLLIIAAAILLVILCINSLSKLGEPSKEEKLAAQAIAMQESQQAYLDELTAEQEKRESNKIRIVAVGDNLIHSGIYKSGMSDDGNYNYDHLYEHIKEDITDADIAIVNQECIFVEDHDNISSYPDFGSPTEIGDALVNAGFDVVQHASNHTYDKGSSAIIETINYWKNEHEDIKVLGIHDSQKSADTISTISCKGVTFALLNYTDILNDEPDDSMPTYMIDRLSEEKLQEDIKKAKDAADITIALLHIGEEYSDAPSEEQKDYLKQLLAAGVDITICAHPHVIQNFETLKDDKGNEMLVYYSLGNFISTQKEHDCMLGGMADITLTKDPETGEFSVSESALVPLVTHYNHDKNIYTVYKLEDYTDELAAEHSILEEIDTFTVESLTNRYKAVLKKDYNTLG